ncbi:hypothetical protein QMQ05_07265 [Glutamicibacter ectropisis]|uniref:Uncharacterized protein n=1 Tax=Glutamicibacter ectropisis TaxID=3046593 RepID=A0AAU6WIG8_9MICC
MHLDVPNNPSSISRRKVLSWTMLGAAGALTTLSGCTTAPQESPSQPTPSATEPPKPVTTAKSTLKNRDPRVISTLKEGPRTPGIARSYPGAFPSVKVKNVEPLRGFGANPYPLLAVSIVGLKNQLQILDPKSKAVRHTLHLNDSHTGGIETMVWDAQRKILYIGAKSIIYSWTPTNPSNINKLGDVEDATVIYELSLDSKGNVWGGTYPIGSVFKYEPSNEKITVFKRLAPEADYVRFVTISSGDVIWAGTGSVNPKVYTFPASNPSNVLEINLPQKVNEGFISSLTTLGTKVAVTASGIKEQLLLDTTTKKWSAPVERVWDRRIASDLVGESANTYTVTDKQLFGTDTVKWTDVAMGAISTDKPLSIVSFRTQVTVIGQSTKGIKIEIFDINSQRVSATVDIPIEPGELTIHSILGHSDGNIYLGGFMGSSVVALNPTSGHSWQSPPQVTEINQIEGMIEFNPTRTYLGSYGGADLISLDTTRRTEPAAYDRFIRLGTKYRQSRPFGWAKNSTNVFFGTVPDYGLSGGVIGMINPGDNSVEWVLDGDGEGFIKGHSIVSLAATDEYLYGTTSVRNGYGIPDTDGAAYVFKFDIQKKKIVWKSQPVSNAGALYTASLVPGWLLVSDVEGIAVIDIRTGKLAKKHKLTKADNSQARAGWNNASIALLDGGDRVVHLASGRATLIDFLHERSHQIGDVATTKLGVRAASGANGKVYATKNQTTLVELDLTVG